MAVFHIHEDLENIAPQQAKIVEKKPSKLQQSREILNDITNGLRGTKRNRVDSSGQECVEIVQKKSDLPLSLDCLKLIANKENISQVEENPKKEESVSDSVLNTKEYTFDIWRYLYGMEANLEWPKVNYMFKQKHLNDEMRSILVDWLVSVADEYKMSEQTIHLAVNYIDRFLSHMSVVREKLQLLGAAAMMLAIKVEEVNILDACEWVYLSGMAYTSKQVTRMEQLLLKILKFDMNVPTMAAFIQQLCVMHELDKKTLFTAMYISELILLEGGSYLQYMPSMLAAASIVLARYILKKKAPCFKKLEMSSGYNFNQLKPIIVKQYKTFKDSPNKEQQAIQSKYKTEKYYEVAKIFPRALHLEI
ncbi:hypothetical protein ILUMI_05014 [Ignelater luminosus]|uniref:Cyclin N-terminal domain-containing protein n=1 Tax=Ignelater luminosus TaxID=2038154 RepID=A0A8K0GJ18_IGNLU|nr:hypothetical protein ILUMI_05014 [Ignelater luminosus]